MRNDYGNKARQNLNLGGRVKAADGLWANIQTKKKRIESGSGEKMRAKGDEGAPSAKALKESQA